MDSGPDLDRALTDARALVEQRFPDSRAAWLAGSVVHGVATATSDLDVTVLLAGPPAPYRESVVHAGWPVELFVHHDRSIEFWTAKDRARRRPTLLRLIGEGRLLLDHEGDGAAWSARCAALLAEGPPSPTTGELEAWRYALTDLLDDLADATDPAQRSAVAVSTWQAVAELLLAAHGRWWGTGKWLVRELRSYDAAHGTSYAERLHAALAAAVDGSAESLIALADEVLGPLGGRLWSGYRAAGAID